MEFLWGKQRSGDKKREKGGLTAILGKTSDGNKGWVD